MNVNYGHYMTTVLTNLMTGYNNIITISDENGAIRFPMRPLNDAIPIAWLLQTQDTITYCQRPLITDSAVALHCGKAHVQSQWETANFDPQ